MSRSGSAPRTVFATADIVPDRSCGPIRASLDQPDVQLHVGLMSYPLELAEPVPRPGAGAAAGGKFGGATIDEKRSAGQYRSDAIADRSAPDGHHHDPVCRPPGRGRCGAGADLEPLNCRAASDLQTPR